MSQQPIKETPIFGQSFLDQSNSRSLNNSSFQSSSNASRMVLKVKRDSSQDEDSKETESEREARKKREQEDVTKYWREGRGGSQGREEQRGQEEQQQQQHKNKMTNIFNESPKLSPFLLNSNNSARQQQQGSQGQKQPIPQSQTKNIILQKQPQFDHQRTKQQLLSLSSFVYTFSHSPFQPQPQPIEIDLPFIAQNRFLFEHLIGMFARRWVSSSSQKSSKNDSYSDNQIRNLSNLFTKTLEAYHAGNVQQQLLLLLEQQQQLQFKDNLISLKNAQETIFQQTAKVKQLYEQILANKAKQKVIKEAIANYRLVISRFVQKYQKRIGSQLAQELLEEMKKSNKGLVVVDHCGDQGKEQGTKGQVTQVQKVQQQLKQPQTQTQSQIQSLASVIPNKTTLQCLQHKIQQSCYKILQLQHTVQIDEIDQLSTNLKLKLDQILFKVNSQTQAEKKSKQAQSQLLAELLKKNQQLKLQITQFQQNKQRPVEQQLLLLQEFIQQKQGKIQGLKQKRDDMVNELRRLQMLCEQNSISNIVLMDDPHSSSSAFYEQRPSGSKLYQHMEGIIKESGFESDGAVIYGNKDYANGNEDNIKSKNVGIDDTNDYYNFGNHNNPNFDHNHQNDHIDDNVTGNDNNDNNLGNNNVHQAAATTADRFLLQQQQRQQRYRQTQIQGHRQEYGQGQRQRQKLKLAKDYQPQQQQKQSQIYKTKQSQPSSQLQQSYQRFSMLSSSQRARQLILLGFDLDDLLARLNGNALSNDRLLQSAITMRANQANKPIAPSASAPPILNRLFHYQNNTINDRKQPSSLIFSQFTTTPATNQQNSKLTPEQQLLSFRYSPPSIYRNDATPPRFYQKEPFSYFMRFQLFCLIVLLAGLLTQIVL